MTAFKDLNVTVWRENVGPNNGQAMKLSELYDHFKFQLIDDGFIEPKEKRWERPTNNDVYFYFADNIKLSSLTPAQRLAMSVEFYNYWDDLDWMVRKTRIKSWKGRANTWIKNNEKYKTNKRKNEIDDDSGSWATRAQ